MAERRKPMRICNLPHRIGCRSATANYGWPREDQTGFSQSHRDTERHEKKKCSKDATHRRPSNSVPPRLREKTQKESIACRPLAVTCDSPAPAMAVVHSQTGFSQSHRDTERYEWEKYANGRRTADLQTLRLRVSVRKHSRNPSHAGHWRWPAIFQSTSIPNPR